MFVGEHAIFRSQIGQLKHDLDMIVKYSEEAGKPKQDLRAKGFTWFYMSFRVYRVWFRDIQGISGFIRCS